MLTVIIFVLCAVSIVLTVQTVLMSTYTNWVYTVKIPAIRAGRPIPPQPLAVRLGERIAVGGDSR